MVCNGRCLNGGALMKSFVSVNEVNELCEALILDFVKSTKHICVDIEGFITEYLKLNIVYAPFAEDDATKEGFLSDGKQGIWIYKNKKKEYTVFPKFTIVLDQYLLREEESGRRRFTLAHEAGHFLLCKHNPEQTVPSYRRTFDTEREYTKEEISDMFSLGEFFADKMAACLLMPHFIIEKAMRKYYRNKKVVVYGNNIFAPEDKVKLRKMADDIGVSFSALVIRLKNLRCFDYHETAEYIDKYLKAGDTL